MKHLLACMILFFLSIAHISHNMQLELKKPKPAKTSRSELNDLVLKQGEDLNPVISDWLKIANPEFKNSAKFPPLELPNGKQTQIKVNNNYFRINESFHSSRNNDPKGPPSKLHFFFRLSGRNIYYSINKTDLNVLGAIHLKDIHDIRTRNSNEDKCFLILASKKTTWKLCAQTAQIKKKWFCQIKKNLNKKLDTFCNNTEKQEPEITVLTKKVTQPIILVPLPQRNCNDGWNYEQSGNNWECTCREGKEQSPVDLPAREQASASQVKPIFQYQEIPSKENLTFELENNTLKIKHKSFGKIVTMEGGVYVAKEIVFHTPSEHRIKGKQYDMEMQIIHTGETKGDIAKHVILSFLFEKNPGNYNKFLDDLDFFNLPSPVDKLKKLTHNIYIPKVLYSSESEDLPIMKPFSFYTYQGSLTAPPCSERTIHYVAADPIPVANVVLELFKEATRVPDMVDSQGNVHVSNLNTNNNRKIQPLNGRTVFYFHNVESAPIQVRTEKPKARGHYEKVEKKMTEYFFVSNAKPSGLPGALVVSEAEAKGQMLQ